MRIKRFNEFDDDIIYIFDFDDTIVVSPNFEQKAMKYLKEDVTVKDLFKKCINEIGIDSDILKYQDRRIYFDDPYEEFKMPIKPKYWIRKGKRIYLLSPDEYCTIDESLPTETKELKDLYNSVKNKCIVTARPEIARSKIEKVLTELGFDKPNYGLYMYNSMNYKEAGLWKGKTIVSIVKDTGFKRVKFYDDNSKYIKGVKTIINSEMPDLDIEIIKVKR